MSTVLDEFLSTVNQSARYVCPMCSKDRKKKTDRTLSVTVDLMAPSISAITAESLGSKQRNHTTKNI
jgi:transposase-like protein